MSGGPPDPRGSQERTYSHGKWARLNVKRQDERGPKDEWARDSTLSLLAGSIFIHQELKAEVNTLIPLVHRMVYFSWLLTNALYLHCLQSDKWWPSLSHEDVFPS